MGVLSPAAVVIDDHQRLHVRRERVVGKARLRVEQDDASQVGNAVSSHGRGLRSVWSANASLSPPPMPLLNDTFTSVRC